MSRKGETGGGGWGHLQGTVLMTVARLGSKRAIVGQLLNRIYVLKG